MTFGLDGPVVTGWWVNPKTGDKFNAIDTFFEDNQMFVKTSDGRLLKYSQIQNYIKTDNPDAFKKPMKESKKTEEIPESILNELVTSDSDSSVVDDLLIPDDNIFDKPGPTPVPSKHHTTTSTNSIIIDKALSKKTSPSIKVGIDWKKFPEREIEMLKDIMDVPIDEVIDYYTNSLDMTEILEEVKANLYTFILEKTQPEEPKKTVKKK